MAQQRGKQAQKQGKPAEQQGQANPSVSRTEEPVDLVQEILGSRAGSRQVRSAVQQADVGGVPQSRSWHPLLQAVSPVSPRVQAKPLFRGVSQEWSDASSTGLVIQPKLMVGAAGDRYEQEADRVAAAVVEQMHSPAVASANDGQAVQRMGEDEDDLRMKPMPLLQREAMDEDDELRLKPMAKRVGAEGGAVSADVEGEINRSRGSGQPLATELQVRMGQAMGADFSGVRVHTDGRSDVLNQSVGARAFTTGQDLFFKRGEYQPGSRGGQELIAHELTHVVQQRSNVIQRNFIIKGRDISVNTPLSDYIPDLERKIKSLGYSDEHKHKIVSQLYKIYSSEEYKEAYDSEQHAIEAAAKELEVYPQEGLAELIPVEPIGSRGEVSADLAELTPSALTSSREQTNKIKEERQSVPVEIEKAKEPVKPTGKREKTDKIKKEIQENPVNIWMEITKYGGILSFEEFAQELSKVHSKDDISRINHKIRQYTLWNSIEQLIYDKFNKIQQTYLLSHLKPPYGLPSFEAKVLIASGLVTGTSADTKEVVHLIEDATPVEKIDLLKFFYWQDGTIPRKLKKYATDYIAEILTAARLEEKYITGEDIDKKRMERDLGESVLENAPTEIKIKGSDLLSKKSKEIIALIAVLEKQHTFTSAGRGVAQSADRIIAWAVRQTPAVRESVCKKGSKLDTYLEGNRKLSTRKDYIFGLIKLPGTEVDDKASEKQEESEVESIQSAKELYLYLESKRKRKSKKWFDRVWHTLAEKIDALGDEGRAKFQEIFKKDEHEHKADSLDTYLTGIGVTGRENKRLVAALTIGSSAQKGSTLWQLRAEVGDLPTENPFLKLKEWVLGLREPWTGKEVVALLTELEGAEYSQLVRDKSLIKSLFERLDLMYSIKESNKYKQQIEELLGIPRYYLSDEPMGFKVHSSKEELTFPPVFPSERRQEIENQTAKGIENMVELRPEHWAIKIIYAAKEGVGTQTGRRIGRKGWSRNKILSLVTQAYYAAKRLQSLGKAPLPPGVTWMKPQDFTKAVLGRVEKSKDGKNAINNSRLSAAKEALEQGRAPTAEERIEGATKRTGWANKDHVIQAIEDAHGLELLDQWTNVEELQALKDSFDKEKDDAKQQKIRIQINGFIPDMKQQVYDSLNSKLGSDFAEVHTVFLNKIADAMENDALFQKALEKEGMSASTVNAEVLRSIAALETEQRDDSAYVQLDTFSAKAAERREAARGVKRELAGAYLKIKSGQVDYADAEKLAKAREGLGDRRAAFTILKEKVKQAVIIAVGVALSIAATITTAGIGQTLVSSILISAVIGALKGGVERAFEGEAYSHLKWAADTLQHAILAAVTVTAGATSSVIAGKAFEMPIGFGAESVHGSEFSSSFFGGLRSEPSQPLHLLHNFADKALNVSFIEVNMRTVAQKMMDLLDPNRDEDLPGLRDAVDQEINVLKDSILKTLNQFGVEKAGATEEMGGNGDINIFDMTKEQADFLGLLIFNETSVAQNIGIFEATSWPTYWQDKLIDKIKSFYAKSEKPEVEPLGQKPGHKVGEKVASEDMSDADKKQIKSEIIQEAYLEGYLIRELNLYFPLEELCEALRPRIFEEVWEAMKAAGFSEEEISGADNKAFHAREEDFKEHIKASDEVKQDHDTLSKDAEVSKDDVLAQEEKEQENSEAYYILEKDDRYEIPKEEFKQKYIKAIAMMSPKGCWGDEGLINAVIEKYKIKVNDENAIERSGNHFNVKIRGASKVIDPDGDCAFRAIAELWMASEETALKPKLATLAVRQTVSNMLKRDDKLTEDSIRLLIREIESAAQGNRVPTGLGDYLRAYLESKKKLNDYGD